MAIVQGLVHAMEFTMAATIRSLGQDVKRSLTFTSPVYLIALSLVGRILSQSASLYADIQMLNPFVPEVLDRAVIELQKLVQAVKMRDEGKFVEQFVRSREHFGDVPLSEASSLFDGLNQLLADRNSAHQVSMTAHEDRPGLLHAITGYFLEAEVNLTVVHSFRVHGGHRFLVGLDRPRENPEVRTALQKIAALGLVCG
jgi:hypothetical protein